MERQCARPPLQAEPAHGTPGARRRRPPGYPQRAPRHPFSEAQLAHIERRLLVCPVLRSTDLHHELRTEYGYAGSYRTFLRQVRPLRP